MASAITPIRTMDLGVALLAMHSARETMGASDQKALEDLVTEFCIRKEGGGHGHLDHR